MPTEAIRDALLAVLDNQATRTEAAFEDLSEEVFRARPGGTCNSILEITRHLVGLRIFQQRLLGHAQAGETEPKSLDSQAGLLEALGHEHARLREAVAGHPADDWCTRPAAPREGPWGDEPTLNRVVRPLNDFANHLGAVRAIRRIMDSPAERTQ